MKRFVYCNNGKIFDIEDLSPSRFKTEKFKDKPLSPKMIALKMEKCGGISKEADSLEGLMESGDLYEVKMGRDNCTMMATDHVLKIINLFEANAIRLFKRIDPNHYVCFAFRTLKEKKFNIVKGEK